MPRSDLIDIDLTSPPFDRLASVHRLGADRRGGRSAEHARHQLYVGRDNQSAARVLIKVTSRPGLVYEQNLTNEIASLTAINRELPECRYFPVVWGDGRMRDGRLYMVSSLFDELPLALAIGTERIADRLVSHLRTARAVAQALAELHGLSIFHVDLNPMNILYRTERGAPVIRIIDFESSYEHVRHSTGVFYNPPTTPGYSAPEVPDRTPDARSDVYSLGAVLYTMLASYQTGWHDRVHTHIEADQAIDSELKTILLTAVAPDPDDRHPSMQVFRNALGAYLERIWPGRNSCA